MDSFYDVLEFGDDETFIKNQIMEAFDWAEMDGEEGIRRLYKNLHDRYEYNATISSCLSDCIAKKIEKYATNYITINMALTYIELF